MRTGKGSRDPFFREAPYSCSRCPSRQNSSMVNMSMVGFVKLEERIVFASFPYICCVAVPFSAGMEESWKGGFSIPRPFSGSLAWCSVMRMML